MLFDIYKLLPSLEYFECLRNSGPSRSSLQHFAVEKPIRNFFIKTLGNIALLRIEKKISVTIFDIIYLLLPAYRSLRAETDIHTHREIYTRNK